MMFKLISFTQLIRQTAKIYQRNFKIILQILLLLIVPILILRLLFHYTNLQIFTIVYAILFGILIALVSVLVKISIIFLLPAQNIAVDARFQTISLPQPQAQSRFKSLLKQAASKFFSYIWLSIITGLITLSVPLFASGLLFLNLAVYYNYLIYFIMILWSFIFSLLFVFVIYALVLENKKGIKAVLYSKNLVFKTPVELAVKIIFLLLFFGAWLIFLSAVINSLVAISLNQFNQLTQGSLPWWAAITIDLCAILGLPFLIIGGGLLFKSAEGR